LFHKNTKKNFIPIDSESTFVKNFNMLKSNPNKSIILWLLSGCFLVYVMVVVGCLTRLTHSGLSITDWNFSLFVPPLSDAAWQDRFAQYQTSPEFKLVNYDMTLPQFKPIFWWEYIHRTIGMFIGVVFSLGYLYFLIKKKLTPKLHKKLLILVGVGALQGLIGWWMVKSGLSKEPAVGHYELATHLMSAFMVFAFTFWFALELINSKSQEKFTAEEKAHLKNQELVSEEAEEVQDPKALKLRPILISFFVVLILQIVYGAFTAGFVEMGDGDKPMFRPGQIFNTWPKMGDAWLPEQATMKSGFFANILENAAGIQFVHRTMAFLVVAFVAFIWIKTNKMKLNRSQYRGVTFLIYGITIQFMLGVYTLLYQVPILLGALHQTGAFFLFATTIYLLFHFRKTKV
jgi:cytochrome c oxidase assembly protein subunit 15